MRTLRNIVALALALCSPLALLFSQDCTDCPTVGPLVKVCTGFVFTEGPVADRLGNLYFTDTRHAGGRIYRLASGKLDLLVANSNRANGLAINDQGVLVACQMSGRVVAYQADGSSCRV